MFTNKIIQHLNISLRIVSICALCTGFACFGIDQLSGFQNGAWLTKIFSEYSDAIRAFDRAAYSMNAQEAWNKFTHFESMITDIIDQSKTAYRVTSISSARYDKIIRELSIVKAVAPVGAFYSFVFGDKQKYQPELETLFKDLRIASQEFGNPTILALLQKLGDEFATKASYENQVHAAQNKIASDTARAALLQIIAAYALEKMTHQKEAIALPPVLAQVLKTLGISQPTRSYDAATNSASYMINNLGEVTDRELLLFTIYGQGSLLDGFCRYAQELTERVQFLQTQKDKRADAALLRNKQEKYAALCAQIKG